MPQAIQLHLATIKYEAPCLVVCTFTRVIFPAVRGHGCYLSHFIHVDTEARKRNCLVRRPDGNWQSQESTSNPSDSQALSLVGLVKMDFFVVPELFWGLVSFISRHKKYTKNNFRMDIGD